MAPKRGGGSSGDSSGSSDGGSSFSSCPSPFSQDALSIVNTPIPYFVSYCLFFLVILGIIIAWFRVKNHHPNARKLVGPIFGLSLLFQLLNFALLIVATMLQECKTMDMFDYYNFAIAYSIFDKLASYLLLVVVVYGLNSFLRSHLGTNPSFMKIIYGAVLGVMGVLTCVYIGMQSYNYWTFTDAGWQTEFYLYSTVKVALAWYILYMLSAVGAGVMAMMSVMSMRSRSMPTNDLTMWVIALSLSMFLWTLFIIIEIAANLDNNYFGEHVFEAFEFIIDFFKSFSWIILLFIAKSPVFKPAANNIDPQVYNQPAYSAAPQQNYVPQPPPQQQYAYNQGNGMPQQQQYYYQQQQAPIHYGTSPVYGNGNIAEVK